MTVTLIALGVGVLLYLSVFGVCEDHVFEEIGGGGLLDFIVDFPVALFQFVFLTEIDECFSAGWTVFFRIFITTAWGLVVAGLFTGFSP